MNIEERILELEKRIAALESRKISFDEEEYIHTHGEVVDKTTAAKLLKVTRATVYAMIADGRISTAYGGKKIDVRSIYRYIHSGGKGGNE